MGLYRPEHGRKGRLEQGAWISLPMGAGNAIRTRLAENLLKKTPREGSPHNLRIRAEPATFWPVQLHERDGRKWQWSLGVWCIDACETALPALRRRTAVPHFSWGAREGRHSHSRRSSPNDSLRSGAS